MSIINKVYLLALVACVSAYPKAEQQAKDETGYWSKFLGKVPDYFKESENVDQAHPSSASAETLLNGEVQNDESNYQSQVDPNKWQDNFKSCVNSNYMSSSPGGTSSGASSGSGYNAPNYDQVAMSQAVEKCRTQMAGQIPSGAAGQNYLSSFQFPNNYIPGAFPGSSSSSSSGASNNA